MGMRRVAEFDADGSIFNGLKCQFDLLDHHEQTFSMVESAASLIGSLFDDARNDLHSKDPLVKADVYFWFACPKSELYEDIGRLLNVTIEPSMFINDVVEAGLPAYGRNGITSLTLDTDNSNEWCFIPPEMDEMAYEKHLRNKLLDLKKAKIAEVNGCELNTQGRAGHVLGAVLKNMDSGVMP